MTTSNKYGYMLTTPRIFFTGLRDACYAGLIGHYSKKCYNRQELQEVLARAYVITKGGYQDSYWYPPSVNKINIIPILKGTYNKKGMLSPDWKVHEMKSEYFEATKRMMLLLADLANEFSLNIKIVKYDCSIKSDDNIGTKNYLVTTDESDVTIIYPDNGLSIETIEIAKMQLGPIMRFHWIVESHATFPTKIQIDNWLKEAKKLQRRCLTEWSHMNIRAEKGLLEVIKSEQLQKEVISNSITNYYNGEKIPVNWNTMEFMDWRHVYPEPSDDAINWDHLDCLQWLIKDTTPIPGEVISESDEDIAIEMSKKLTFDAYDASLAKKCAREEEDSLCVLDSLLAKNLSLNKETSNKKTDADLELELALALSLAEH